jgi:hypothetical protein
MSSSWTACSGQCEDGRRLAVRGWPRTVTSDVDQRGLRARDKGEGRSDGIAFVLSEPIPPTIHEERYDPRWPPDLVYRWRAGYSANWTWAGGRVQLQNMQVPLDGDLLDDIDFMHACTK